LRLAQGRSEFPIEISTKPLAAEKGLVVTSAIRDITDRKRWNNKSPKLNKELERRAVELENANQELEAFSYSVSHDLRSPLRTSDSFSQILMEDYANPARCRGPGLRSATAGELPTLQDIIDALLALSKI